MVSGVNECSRSIRWLSDGELNMKETRETMRKDLKYDENDEDDSGELANLLILIVMYRVYVG